jgi:YidC/Oxa1 family membrane protein insertase
MAQRNQPSTDAQTAQTSKTMNMMMPLMSVWICFSMPALMGVYWIEQSVLAIVQEEILTKIYQKQVDAEMSGFLAAERAKEEEIERRRAETERLRAEGKTQQNTNTSKKRLAAAERNAEEQRQAAARAAERAAKGIVDEIPPSQVGTRRYARGRAYDPDRYADEASEAERPATVEENEE